MRWLGFGARPVRTFVALTALWSADPNEQKDVSCMMRAMPAAEDAPSVHTADVEPLRGDHSDGNGVNPEWFLPLLTGTNYYAFLETLHQVLKPASYIEVGVRKGRAFMAARCPSIAIDPVFKIERNVIGNKPVAHFAQKTSDDFFAECNPCNILGVQHIDMFFLDGMHLCDFLLRDFINSEKLARQPSLIVLHDCLPLDIPMTRRGGREVVPYPRVHDDAWWTGDVWRLIPILKKYRPDLSISCLDCQPTGLVLVTNLDPASTVLQGNYKEICQEMLAMDLGRIGLRSYAANLPVLSAGDFTKPERILKHFAFSRLSGG